MFVPPTAATTTETNSSVDFEAKTKTTEITFTNKSEENTIINQVKIINDSHGKQTISTSSSSTESIPKKKVIRGELSTKERLKIYESCSEYLSYCVGKVFGLIGKHNDTMDMRWISSDCVKTTSNVIKILETPNDVSPEEFLVGLDAMIKKYVKEPVPNKHILEDAQWLFAYLSERYDVPMKEKK